MIQFRRIVSEINSIEIKNLKRLRRLHGGKRWRKVKGSAYVD